MIRARRSWCRPHFALFAGQRIVNRAAHWRSRPVNPQMLIARAAIAGLTAIAAVVVTTSTAAATAALTTALAAAAACISLFTARILFGFGRLASGQGQPCGFLLKVIGQAQRHQLDPGQALDIAQIGLFVRRAEADCDAVRPGARGAPDPVDILFGHIGQLKVEHVADPGHVNPARGNIGRDQHRRGALAERQQRGGALGLALVAVNRRSIDPGDVEVAHHPVRTVLGPREHQRAFNLVLAFGFRQPATQLEAEQRLLFRLIQESHELIDPLRRGRLR